MLTKEQQQGASGTCETMKVKSENAQGFMLINAHDFDKEKHEPFEEKKPAAAVKDKK